MDQNLLAVEAWLSGFLISVGGTHLGEPLMSYFLSMLVDSTPPFPRRATSTLSYITAFVLGKQRVLSSQI